MSERSELNHEDAIDVITLRDECKRLKDDLSNPKVYMPASEKDLENWTQEIKDIAFVIKQIVNGKYRRA